jgi:putrescine:ornithine antiporter
MAATVCAMAIVAAAPLAQTPTGTPQAVQQPSGTLNRIRTAGAIRLGYRTDVRPFAYRDESGRAAGYAVALCERIADAARAENGLGGLRVEWVPVTADDRFQALEQGQVDVLCGADTVTLERRARVSFSIPIFPGGVGALVRADAPARLREVLTGRGQTFRPTWRASATQVLQARAFSAVEGTTSDMWLTQRVRELGVIAPVARVSGYDTGVQGLLDRRSDAFFGERAVLLDAAARGNDLVVIDRLFTYEPLALALPHGDDEFRLLVDRTLSRFYASGDLGALYTKWFGEPDSEALTFFRWNALQD